MKSIPMKILDPETKKDFLDYKEVIATIAGMRIMIVMVRFVELIFLKCERVSESLKRLRRLQMCFCLRTRIIST